MAAIHSNGTGGGTFSVGASWSGGVVPGTGDTAYIDAGDTITLTDSRQLKQLYLNGGSFVLNYDLLLDDASGAGINIGSTNSGGFSSNGAYGSPRAIKSASSNPDQPTNPWSIQYQYVIGQDDRSLNFDYVEFKGNKHYLGNTNYQIYLNDSTDPDKITAPFISAPMPGSGLLENPVPGRGSSIVYPRSVTACRMSLSGDYRKDSHFSTILKLLIRSKTRIAFFSKFYHMPKCYIDGSPTITPKGGLYNGYSINLVEDI